MDLVTIGTLAGIAKTVIDSLKALKDFVARPGSPPIIETAAVTAVVESFSAYQGRISVLADQLAQAETLVRMLPVWLQEQATFEVWEDPAPDETLRRLDRGLRQFISDSIRDHFSALFFQTSFDKLPGVPEKLDVIRQELKELERSLKEIPHSNIAAWRVHLPVLKVRLNDLRSHASDLDHHATDLRGELVRELQDAARIAAT